MIEEPYRFVELDPDTRAFMLAELDLDLNQHGRPYQGKFLTEKGLADYEQLLRESITGGDEVEFVAALNQDERVTDDVSDAARRLGRTEFNRYYIRGVCRRAGSHGTNAVVVYRAHGSEVPRATSTSLVGTEQSAPRILANMRASQGDDTDTGLGRVNSGLTVRCGCTTCLQA